MSMLEVTGLRKVYASRLSANKVEALKNVNFTVEEGDTSPSWAKADRARRRF